MSDDEEVITPGGPRPRSRVQGVAPGQTVRRPADGTYGVDGDPAGEQVLTPGGLRAKSRVHRVEPGHAVDAARGRLQIRAMSGETVADLGEAPVAPRGRPLMPRNVVLPPAAEVEPAFGTGWITYGS